ncbi:hypothetical protein MHU86_20603 [Fragilaria crotonensis]|nr:hypothetical protein MHU86_20603 [Fragilaria crotonensis]
MKVTSVAAFFLSFLTLSIAAVGATLARGHANNTRGGIRAGKGINTTGPLGGAGGGKAGGTKLIEGDNVRDFKSILEDHGPE